MPQLEVLLGNRCGNVLCHGVGRLIGWLQILRRQIVPFQHTNLTLVNV